MVPRALSLVLLLSAAPALAQDDVWDEGPEEPIAGWIEVRAVEGPLSLEQARAAAAESRALLARCARARARGPETMVAERVDFEFVVRSGRVTRLDLLELDPEDRRVPSLVRWRRCAAAALRRLRFPAAGESTVRASLFWSRGTEPLPRTRER
ncbi:MAG TPA: hypothetical protein VIN61_09600 [Gammaproteobacteria bacterium]